MPNFDAELLRDFRSKNTLCHVIDHVTKSLCNMHVHVRTAALVSCHKNIHAYEQETHSKLRVSCAFIFFVTTDLKATVFFSNQPCVVITCD